MNDVRADLHSRGYTIELREEEDGSWSALVPELPGAVAVGDTPNDAVEELPAVIDLWIAAASDRGMPVPAPRREESANGKVLVRLPRTVHARLVRAAREEGVTLNAYCVSVLSAGLAQALERTRASERQTAYFGGVTAVQPARTTHVFYSFEDRMYQPGEVIIANTAAFAKVAFGADDVKDNMKTYFGILPRHTSPRTDDDTPPGRQSTLALSS